MPRLNQGVDEVRKVVAYELLSLDGVAEEPDEFVTSWDDVMDENLGRVISTQDAVLLGHRTYDHWSKFWPTSNIEPFAKFINGVEKFVIATTATTQNWSNSVVVSGDLFEFVSKLKRQSGEDIGVHGSIRLFQSLCELELVDELRLVISPAIHIRGRKLFEKGLPSRLTMTRQVVSPTGYLLLDYEVQRSGIK